jgi:hypothetical protein
MSSSLRHDRPRTRSVRQPHKGYSEGCYTQPLSRGIAPRRAKCDMPLVSRHILRLAGAVSSSSPLSSNAADVPEGGL